MEAEVMDQVDWSGLQDLPLSARREALTSGFHSSEIAHAVTEIITRAASGCRAELTPLRELRRVLEGMRALPPSIERLRRMNTFVRTLGQPNHLAILLDVLRGRLKSHNASRRPVISRIIASQIIVSPVDV
jgi:hypothetical protein